MLVIVVYVSQLKHSMTMVNDLEQDALFGNRGRILFVHTGYIARCMPKTLVCLSGNLPRDWGVFDARTGVGLGGGVYYVCEAPRGKMVVFLLNLLKGRAN